MCKQEDVKQKAKGYNKLAGTEPVTLEQSLFRKARSSYSDYEEVNAIYTELFVELSSEARQIFRSALHYALKVLLQSKESGRL